MPQRRERYVFRPVLIKILEAYFREAPFPDSAKRAEIAAACNRALQAEKKGMPPSIRLILEQQFGNFCFSFAAHHIAERIRELRPLVSPCLH